MHFQGADIEISWNEWWSPFIGEILTLVASIWLYKYVKDFLCTYPINQPLRII
jgi:hypothetical protein